MSKNYLDPEIYHKELVRCKKAGVLSKEAINMFMVHAKETSRDFYFGNKQDQEDAIQQATHDLIKYWKNFKESNVVQFRINKERGFKEGDKILIHLKGHDILEYTASNDNNFIQRKFAISNILKLKEKTVDGKSNEKNIKKNKTYNTNKTLINFMEMSKIMDGREIEVSVDKVRNRLTIMDIFNRDDLSFKSFVKIETIDGKPLTLTGLKEYEKKDGEYGNMKFMFKEPPDIFSYATSIVRNGCLKSINKNNPEHTRNGKKISMDQINSDANGMYNLV